MREFNWDNSNGKIPKGHFLWDNSKGTHIKKKKACHVGGLSRRHYNMCMYIYIYMLY